MSPAVPTAVGVLALVVFVVAVAVAVVGLLAVALDEPEGVVEDVVGPPVLDVRGPVRRAGTTARSGTRIGHTSLDRAPAYHE